MKQFTIILYGLNSPREICYIMEKRNVKYYTYTFHTNETVIKEGKAADNEWVTGTWGNRIYRQAGGINGWGSNRLHDTSALKMTSLMAENFPLLNRNDVAITVYDYTDELKDCDHIEIERFLLNEENKKVKEHVDKFGYPPKLNIAPTRPHPKPMFDEMFEVME
jgi:hypothetical protein